MILYRSPKAAPAHEHIWLDRSKFQHYSAADENRLETVTSFALRNLDAPFSVWVRLKEAETPTVHLDNIGLDITDTKKSTAGFVWRRSRAVRISPAVAAVHRVLVGGLRSKTGCSSLVFTNEQEFVPPNTQAQFEKKIYGASRADLGKSELTPAETIVRAEHVYRFKYTAGKSGIAVGGGIAVGIPWGLFPVPTWPEIAARPVEASGNSELAPLRIVSPDDKNLRLFIEDRRQVWFATREYLVRIEAAEHPLKAGDTIEMMYGSEDRKVRNHQTFPHLYYKTEKDCWYTDTVPLRVLVDHSGSGQYVPVVEENSHTLAVRPGRPARLHVTVPSVVRRGKPIALRLAITDEHNSLPDPPVGGAMGGVEFQNSVGAANITLSSGGRLQIKVEIGQKPLVAASNPVEVAPNPPPFGLYWGEIHGHCALCDGVGTPERYFEHARYVAHLDFASLTDHAPYLGDGEWQYIQEIANKVHVTGKFATIIGYEWSGRGGHRNVYTSSPELELLRANDGVDRLENLWAALKGRTDILVVPHHSLSVGRLTPHDPDLERLIEIYSMWGCSERQGHPLSDKPPIGASVQEIFSEGNRLGIIAGSDNHDGRPGCSGDAPGVKSRYGNLTFKAGLTAVYAEKLSRQSIFASLYKRRCYATTGERIIVEFKVNGRWMGEEIPAVHPRLISVFVVGADKIERVEIIRNNEVAHTHRPGSEAARFEWVDETPFDAIAIRPEGAKPFAFYYLRTTQANGEIAWTSPVWVSGE